VSPRPLGPAPETVSPGGVCLGPECNSLEDHGKDCGTAVAELRRAEAEAVMSAEQARYDQADRLRCLDEVQRITAGRDFDARDLVVLAHYVHTGEEMPYQTPPREPWELG
jgi:hypothetical protein